MRHMKYIIDIEADGFKPSRVWCIVVRSVETGLVTCFTYKGRYGCAPIEDFNEWYDPEMQLIGHNIVSYDIPVLNQLLGVGIRNEWLHVVDTFVVSRLVNYKGYTTHSLEEIGLSLGHPKTEFDDWDNFTEVMLEYCKNDVEVNTQIYDRFKRFINDPAWNLSMWCEHWTSTICKEMHDNGFHFNKNLATRRLQQLEEEMGLLESEMAKFEPFKREVARIQYKINKDGSLHANIRKAYDRYGQCLMEGNELVGYNFVDFNPNSTKDRIEKLWEFGWDPIEKTDTAYKFKMQARPNRPWGKKKRLTQEEYDAKKDYFNYYGWTVNEVNLETLPADAPEGGRLLAKWLTLNGRRSALRERLQNLEPDSRIRTNFWFIGSWTHRMSHSSPNLANISSPFHGEPQSPVEEIKAEYDADMRTMFDAEEGYLVGTDAESIQLRILAHYLKNDEYVQAILEGNKADETDIHNVNRRSLGLDHLTRDHAKTFIYAWLLGAGVAKVSRILACSHTAAKEAVDNFIERTEGLSSLKSGQIRRDAGRGYFVGLDGRKVINNSDYLMLAGYLQNGETIVMKHANILWRQAAIEEKIRFKQVNFVHDEWQTQVYDSLDAAERIGVLQCEALTKAGEQLGCYCPMAGETRIGPTWLETH